MEERAARVGEDAGRDREGRAGIGMNDGELLAWLIAKGFNSSAIVADSA